MNPILIAWIVVIVAVIAIASWRIFRGGNPQNIQQDVQDVEQAVQDVEKAEPTIATDVQEVANVVAQANTLVGATTAKVSARKPRAKKTQ